MRTADDEVFLTGGSGFVGGHVLRELLSAGYRVRALSRTNNLVDGVTVVTGDLQHTGEFARAMEDAAT